MTGGQAPPEGSAPRARLAPLPPRAHRVSPRRSQPRQLTANRCRCGDRQFTPVGGGWRCASRCRRRGATRREKPEHAPPPPPAEGLAQSVSLYLARTVGALSEFEDALLREEGFFARQEHLEAQIDRVREEFERNERARTLFADPDAVRLLIGQLTSADAASITSGHVRRRQQFVFASSVLLTSNVAVETIAAHPPLVRLIWGFVERPPPLDTVQLQYWCRCAGSSCSPSRRRAARRWRRARRAACSRRTPPSSARCCSTSTRTPSPSSSSACCSCPSARRPPPRPPPTTAAARRRAPTAATAARRSPADDGARLLRLLLGGDAELLGTAVERLLRAPECARNAAELLVAAVDAVAGLEVRSGVLERCDARSPPSSARSSTRASARRRARCRRRRRRRMRGGPRRRRRRPPPRGEHRPAPRDAAPLPPRPPRRRARRRRRRGRRRRRRRRGGVGAVRRPRLRHAPAAAQEPHAPRRLNGRRRRRWWCARAAAVR